MSEYGRSPAVAVLPDYREQIAEDERDIKLMMGDDVGEAKAAQERFMARRRPLWREMGLL